jgi:hypothetical protein
VPILLLWVDEMFRSPNLRRPADLEEARRFEVEKRNADALAYYHELIVPGPRGDANAGTAAASPSGCGVRKSITWQSCHFVRFSRTITPPEKSGATMSGRPVFGACPCKSSTRILAGDGPVPILNGEA